MCGLSTSPALKHAAGLMGGMRVSVLWPRRSIRWLTGTCAAARAPPRQVYLGPLKLQLPSSRRKEPASAEAARTPGYVDWLYLSDTLRITRGNKGSLFVHVREQPGAEEGEAGSA